MSFVTFKGQIFLPRKNCNYMYMFVYPMLWIIAKMPLDGKLSDVHERVTENQITPYPSIYLGKVVFIKVLVI